MNNDVKNVLGDLGDENESFGLTNSKMKFDANNYLNVRLAPGETKRTMRIRILPISKDTNKIQVPIHIHSLKVDREISTSGFKTFICLEDKHLEGKNTECGCPLCNHSREIFKTVNELPPEKVEERKALSREAYKYRPKTSYIVRAIERGKEDEGPKFWRFNKFSDGAGIMDQIVNLFNQRNEEAKEAGEVDGYNIFDLENGKDLILTLTKGENTDRTEISIMDAGIRTPLSKDPEKVKAWINDPKSWSDVYTCRPESYLQVIADGGIPVYDRAMGKFISKKDKEELDKKSEREAINEIKPNIGTNVDNVSESDDLPF